MPVDIASASEALPPAPPGPAAAAAARAYDAFISYSHAKDKAIAAALQSVAQRLGKAWSERRALRLFRDDTSLSATPHLWPSIQRALGDSRFLILLASPEAASSQWVNQEVTWWLDHNNSETILIALTAGELAWDVLAQHDAAGALAAFRAAQTTMLAHAQKGPNNLGWQYDLSIANDKIGDALKAQGDVAGALASYRETLIVLKALAGKDPANTAWQRALSVGDNKIGDALKAQGDVAGALAAYRDSIPIIRALAEKDQSNVGWQLDLVVTLTKAVGAGDDAAANYSEALGVLQRLDAAGNLPADKKPWLSAMATLLANVKKGS